MLSVRPLDTGSMNGGPSRAVWHITWDRNGVQPLVPFSTLRQYFSTGGAGMAPHLLWNPFTGEIVQFFPANSRALALANGPNGQKNNRVGAHCVQIEILFFPGCVVNGKSYKTVAETPRIGLDKIVAWLRSLGIPDRWPLGTTNWSNGPRNNTTWLNTSGHYGHQHVPGNNHTDPGPLGDIFKGGSSGPSVPPPATSGRRWRVTRGQTLGGIAAALGISLAALLGVNPDFKANPDHVESGDIVTVPPGAPGTVPPGNDPGNSGPSNPGPGTDPGAGNSGSCPVFPGASYFGPGKNNAHVTTLGRGLVARGYGSYYRVGPGPVWSWSADGAATQALQKRMGFTGSDADGIPGPASWRAAVCGISTPANSSTPPAFPGRSVVAPGLTSPYVTMLDRKLIERGYGKYYTSGAGPYYGRGTEAAVRAYLSTRPALWSGTGPDAAVGPKTWDAIFSGR
ncbi:peptidoglycan-binding protein [Yinghuangia aomiensis]